MHIIIYGTDFLVVVRESFKRMIQLKVNICGCTNVSFKLNHQLVVTNDDSSDTKPRVKSITALYRPKSVIAAELWR